MKTIENRKFYYFICIADKAKNILYQRSKGKFSLVHIQSVFSFWTLGLPEGVLSNHPCGQSVCPSVFRYLRDRSLVFSKTLQEVEGQ